MLAQRCCPRLYDWERELTEVIPEKLPAAFALWYSIMDMDHYQGMPDGVALSASENEEYAAKMNDITTYLGEYTLNIITGAADLESTWDGFVQSCYDMGLEDCTALQQAALDRYWTR